MICFCAHPGDPSLTFLSVECDGCGYAPVVYTGKDQSLIFRIAVRESKQYGIKHVEREGCRVHLCFYCRREEELTDEERLDRALGVRDDAIVVRVQ